jgi:hypothetical protein
MSDPGKQLTFKFEDRGDRSFRPSRPMRHGRTKWLRGHVQVGGVLIRVVASPNGISLPAGVSLCEELRKRVDSFLTAEAAKLNCMREGTSSLEQGGRAA